MLRTLTCLAIVLWHAPLQKFAGASQLLQIMYHVSEVPSGMFWAAGNSEEVVARSALHCASKSLAKAGVGYTYLSEYTSGDAWIFFSFIKSMCSSSCFIDLFITVNQWIPL